MKVIWLFYLFIGSFEFNKQPMISEIQIKHNKNQYIIKFTVCIHVG
jgi:hypothetical protein